MPGRERTSFPETRQAKGKPDVNENGVLLRSDELLLSCRGIFLADRLLTLVRAVMGFDMNMAGATPGAEGAEYGVLRAPPTPLLHSVDTKKGFF